MIIYILQGTTADTRPSRGWRLCESFQGGCFWLRWISKTTMTLWRLRLKWCTYFTACLRPDYLQYSLQIDQNRKKRPSCNHTTNFPDCWFYQKQIRKKYGSVNSNSTRRLDGWIQKKDNILAEQFVRKALTVRQKKKKLSLIFVL